MKKYCFILGKNPFLSLAEIFNLAERLNYQLRIIDITNELLIVESEDFSAQKWQKLLGGTIKIGEIISHFNSAKSLLKYINTKILIDEFFSQSKKKIIFGFSNYGVSTVEENSFNKLGFKLKKKLQGLDYKARFIETTGKNLSSVQVTKNKIIATGADIIIAGGLNSIYLGRTLTVQEFEGYSMRDYGRPSRDAKSGMLPPKLAQILINLSQTKNEGIILDPFCGSGTILQEAILMDYKNLIGNDISPKAFEDTKNNISWLSEKFKLKNLNIKYFQNDVANLSADIKESSIDAIVTEPFLGPPVNKNYDDSKINDIISELEQLYLNAFKVFKKIIKPDSRIVIIFPLYKFDNSVYHLKILEALQELGFKRLRPFPDDISLFSRVGLTARGSLVYKRPNQIVQREVFIFQYKKS